MSRDRCGVCVHGDVQHVAKSPTGCGVTRCCDTCAVILEDRGYTVTALPRRADMNYTTASERARARRST